MELVCLLCRWKTSATTTIRRRRRRIDIFNGPPFSIDSTTVPAIVDYFGLFVAPSDSFRHAHGVMVDKSQSNTMRISIGNINLTAIWCAVMISWMIIILSANAQPFDSLPKWISYTRNNNNNNNREFVCGSNNINSVKLFKRLLAFILYFHLGRMFLTRFCLCSCQLTNAKTETYMYIYLFI